MADFTIISDKIRFKRRSLNMSQVELAEKAGISVNSVRLCEGGKVQPRIETLTKIAVALGEDPSTFLGMYPLTGDGEAESVVELRQAALKQSLLDAFDSMNLLGKKQSVSIVSDLAKVPEYQKGYTARKLEPYQIKHLTQEEREKIEKMLIKWEREHKSDK